MNVDGKTHLRSILIWKVDQHRPSHVKGPSDFVLLVSTIKMILAESKGLDCHPK